MGAVNRIKNNNSPTMDKRSLCCLIICVNLCFVIWLVSVQQLEPTDEAVATAGSTAALLGSPQLQTQQPQQQQQPSANGSKPNQIHDTSRTQQLSSNLSSYYYSRSLVSLDNNIAATPASLPTAASRPSPSSASLSSSLPTGYSDDASQLIDLHNFAYSMTQPPCGAHIQALILVHTAPRNVEKRALIRQTWGSPRMTSASSPLRVVFLLGAVPQSEPELQLALRAENARHADMVQGNFQDAYRNMTYKHVMALKWFNSHCAHAQLLIKVDDDVYVNTPQLYKLLREPMLPNTSSNSNSTTPSLRSMLQQRNELLFCRSVLLSRVRRSYRSKWRVSFSEYPDAYYPPYCPGFAIVYSADVVQRLYQAAQHAGYFWVDDVHITGVLAQRTNTTITNLQPYVLFKTDCERVLSGELELDQQEFLFTWHSIAPEQLNALWQLHLAQNYTLTQRSVQLEAEAGSDTGLS